MLACPHQSVAILLPAAASFWPPAQVSKSSLAGTNLQLGCCPPLHLFGPRCCPALHLFALPRRYLCSLVGTNLQPRCCPALHLFGPRCCSPALYPFGLPRRYVFMLACRHQSAAALLPTATSFWPPAQVTDWCWAERAWVPAREAKGIQRRAAARAKKTQRRAAARFKIMQRRAAARAKKMQRLAAARLQICAGRQA
jgi:hypothetical protein